MKGAGIAVFAWIVPGGAALLKRDYRSFAITFLAVAGAVVCGIALQGGNQWPGADDLKGVDGLAALAARVGALAKLLAGGPILVADLLGYSHSYLDSRVHEQGTTLLLMAGLFNLFVIAKEFERQ